MKPWKSRSPSLLSTPSIPLQWGHGDEAVEEPGREISEHRTDRLQWGHGDEAVEEDAELIRSNDFGLASMGPRR